ncbi:MAG: cytochrome c [bacterium]|nr:cytochrome c [bacterium]
MTENRPSLSPKPTAVVLVVVLYVLALAFFLVGRGISLRSDDRLFPRADFPAEDLVFDATAVPAVRGKQTAPVDLAQALEATAEALVRGQGLFETTCSSCHGQTGRGDGAAGAGLDPPVRNFAQSEGWKNGTLVTEIFRTLTQGIAGSSMAAYDYLPAEDRFALAHYVRSLGDFPHAVDTPESVAALDREYGLAEGVREPHRIPVALAVERISAETPTPLLLPEPREDEGMRIFRVAVADPARASATLAAREDWRSDTAALARLVTAGAPANGFSPAAATLSVEEWELLRENFAAAVAEAEVPAQEEMP